MIYIDENHQADDILKYLHDIRKELEIFRHTMVGLGTVLIIIQVLSAVLK